MPRPRRISVIIVGAGFGGLAAAIELRRHGFTDVTLLERADGPGGTWRDNDYPGCACDVPSQLYSFSYATRRDWPRLCSPQAEILGYLEKVAAEHGIDRLLETGVDVVSCRWNSAASSWTVSSANGRRWEADALILATGQLHQPAVPAIPGRFDGPSFHSARWDHSVDLRGRRVAVIGTGASAVQFVPEVARDAERLYVFQRTGNWFMPRRNRAYPPALLAVIRHVPWLQAFRRRFIYYYAESLTMMIRNPRTWGRIGHLRSALFMRWQLRDPVVRRKAWPDYTFGCKRVLFSSYYLPALQQPGVELVTDRIVRLDPAGVVTEDGFLREVDCVIYGTGFRATEFMFPMEVVGGDDVSLGEEWASGAHAHLGIAVPGFPSMFLMYGPNTNTSGGSIVFYEEAQAAYIRQALVELDARGAASVEVRRAVEASSDRETQARFAGTAWTRCDSWYRDEGGRIVTNWPGYMTDYAERVRELDPSEFTFAPAA